MRNDPAGATGEAMPDHGTVPPFYREEHHPAEAVQVRALPAAELPVLCDAFDALAEALTAVLNQPCCKDGSAVRAWIDGELARIDDTRSYAIQEMERRPMTGDRWEDEQRIGYVAAWDLKTCGGGVLETLAKIARMQAAHQAAASAARRGG